MKQIYRCLSFAFGIALSCLCITSVQADTLAYSLRQAPELDYLVSHAQFKAELAHNHQAQVLLASTVNSDLTREGHGFRQVSAAEEPVTEITLS